MHPYTTEYVKLTNEEWQRVFSGLCSSRFRFHIVFAVIGAAMSIFGFVVGEDMLLGKLLIYAGVGTLGGAIGDRVYLNWYLKSM